MKMSLFNGWTPYGSIRLIITIFVLEWKKVKFNFKFLNSMIMNHRGLLDKDF